MAPGMLAVGYIVLLTCTFAWACWVTGTGRIGGQPSPPQNVFVELLDFQAEVRWHRVNPPNTKYTVEIKECGGQWAPVENCTQIAREVCHIDFPLDLDELMKCYFLRVNAMCNGKSSSQGYQSSFQPYGDSVISGPKLDVSVQNNSIYVETHHHLESVLSNFTYSINLTQRTTDQDILISMVKTRSSWRFPDTDLSPGNYCVSSSVNFQQQQRYHHRSERCTLLPEQPFGMEGWFLVFLMCSLLLSAVFLIMMYLKTTSANSSMPKILREVAKANGTMVLPMATPVQPVCLCANVVSVESNDLRHNSLLPSEKPSSSAGYDSWGTFSWLCHTGSSSPPAEPADGTSLQSSDRCGLYREVQDDDECTWMMEGQACSREEPLGESMQQAQDVTLSSLTFAHKDEGCHMIQESCHEEEGHGKGDETQLEEPSFSEYHLYQAADLPELRQAWSSEYEPREPIIPVSHMDKPPRSEYHLYQTADLPELREAWSSEYEPREPIIPASHMDEPSRSEYRLHQTADLPELRQAWPSGYEPREPMIPASHMDEPSRSEYRMYQAADLPELRQAWPSGYEPREPIIPASHMNEYRGSQVSSSSWPGTESSR